jgi:uncharacterized iron-regulated membrane protein
MPLSLLRRVSLARWHIWLGWLVAVPLLLWTISGLFMVSFPIEQVRGEHLRAEPRTLSVSSPIVAPPLEPGVSHVELLVRVDGPRWVIHGTNERITVRDATSGRLSPPVDSVLAGRIADAVLKDRHRVISVRRIAADANPIDLRRDRPAWQVTYVGGLRVYVDADTGEVLAVRTQLWRAFDVMWGLHIMDLEGREDTHHPILVGSAALGFVAVLIGTILLFRRRRSHSRVAS